MKKYSDYFSGLKRSINSVGNRIATTALFMVAAITMGFAQEPYHFIEGSVHKFSVTPNSENTFVWGMYSDLVTGIALPSNTYDLRNGGISNDLEIKFNDMDRDLPEMVYLVVQETNPSGCSTKRALQIQLEPNNMYLEFADKITQDCYNLNDYQAQLKIGLNFKDKAGGIQIPENRFPLEVEYTVQNITKGATAEPGNGGEPLTLTFNTANEYYLLVKMPETVGLPDETTIYELVITSVKDKYDAEIKLNPEDVRRQIRTINHLPQSGNMDMALAYYIIK